MHELNSILTVSVDIPVVSVGPVVLDTFQLVLSEDVARNV